MNSRGWGVNQFNKTPAAFAISNPILLRVFE